MGRVLLGVWPFPTHLRPNLALAVALREAGHEVLFYTGATARPLLEAEGFRMERFVHVDEAAVRETVGHVVEARRHPWRARRRWREFLAETVPGQIADLRAILHAWPADVIVCDLAMWGPMLVLFERDRVPVAVFSHLAHCLLPGPEGPVTGVALPRRRGPALELYARSMRLAAGLVTAGARRRASRLRRRYGLPSLEVSMSEFAGRMPLYLVPSAPELDHRRGDLPASVHYVGPCLWPPPARPAERAAHGRPLVLVEEGALYSREPALLRCAAAALGAEAVDVALLPGEGRDPGRMKLGTLPPNVRVAPASAFPGLLAEARLVISNGNSESVLRALCAGVPVIVVPSLWDQAEVSWQVAEAGVGQRIAERSCTSARLRAALADVLRDSTYARRAGEMAEALHRAGGPPRAAALVTSLLMTERPGRLGAVG